MTVKPTIVFDLDGTLADTIPDIVASLNHTLAGHDLPPFDPQEVAHLTGKGGLRAMIALAFELAQRTANKDQLEQVFSASVQRYDQNIAVETVLYPNVRACLEACRAEGWLLAVCTNKPIQQANKLLRALDIDHYFSAITGAGSFEFRKPDPRHLTQTIELAGGDPKRAIMAGDTIMDITTAKNAGIPIIAVDFGYSDVDVATLSPERVISNYDALYETAVGLLK